MMSTNTSNDSGDAPATRQPLIRSCLSCHARRIKCDKGHPCASCTRINAECIYPSGKATRRRRKRQNDAELLGRIRELESAVDKLGSLATVSYDGSKTSSESPGQDDHASPSTDLGTATLVVGQDTSQYLSSAFWVKMSEEIAELKDAMQASDHDSSDDEATYSMPPSMHQAFVFGNPQLVGDHLKRLRPSPQHIFVLWEAYRNNVDTLVKSVHQPTARALMTTAISNPDQLSRPGEALMFAICFGAVVSMEKDQCLSLLGEPREELLKRYRIGTEQALARSSFLNNSSLTSLHAFAIYIVMLRCLDESRTVWALCSLATRLAVSLGLHRDGTNFNLKPFDCEMRRRLWWFIWQTSRRSNEDHGLSPVQDQGEAYDVRLPLNVNDDDLQPAMTELPPEREGWTDMFGNCTRLTLLLWFMRNVGKKDMHGSTTRAEALLEEGRTMMTDRFLRHLDVRDHGQFVAYSSVRLMLVKAWLYFALPGNPDEAASKVEQLPAERERVFERAVEAIEVWVALVSHADAQRWNWFAPAIVQWQLVCYVLAQIPKRGDDPMAARAWAAIGAAWALPHIRPKESNSSVLWKALKLVYTRAKAHKDKLDERRERIKRERQALLEQQLQQHSLIADMGPTTAAPVTQDYVPQQQQQQSFQQQQPLTISPTDLDFDFGPVDMDLSENLSDITGLNPSALGFEEYQPTTLGAWDDMPDDFMSTGNGVWYGPGPDMSKVWNASI